MCYIQFLQATFNREDKEYIVVPFTQRERDGGEAVERRERDEERERDTKRGEW